MKTSRPNALVYLALVLVGLGLVVLLATRRIAPVPTPPPLPDVYEPAPSSTVNPDLRSM